MKLSFVLPVYNEQENIHPVYETLSSELKKLGEQSYEIIFVDDGSKDASWNKIRELSDSKTDVRGLRLSRNFGHQVALTAGYDYAHGDAIVSLDADLQDPPEVIPALIAKWQEGYDIVYARRINRQDSAIKKITAWCYYWLLDMISDVRMPRNVGDFRLIDRKVLDALKQCREKARYLRGMVAWTGYKHAFVDFKRHERASGKTGYTWKKMLALAWDGITGFSMFPLKIAAFIGTFVVGSGMLMFCYITLDFLLRGVYYPLFKWLVTVIYTFMGVQFLLLWLLGEYIGRIYEQQKDRPLYLIDRIIKKEK